MAQRVEALALQAGEPEFDPQTEPRKESTDSQKLISDFHTYPVMCMPVFTHITSYAIIKINKIKLVTLPCFEVQ